MKPLDVVRMALASLWRHKGRTALTIAGVMIGVGAVLAVVTLGAAFENSITGQFDSIDDRAILVTASQGDIAQGPPDAGPFGLIFTEVDRQALQEIDGVDEMAASGIVPVTGLTVQERSLPFERLQAVSATETAIREPADYATGSVFEAGQAEVVLGHTIARLLGDGEPVTAGTEVTLEFADRTRNVTVAGVLAFQDSLFGSANREVFVPLDPFYDQQRTSPTTGERTLVYNGLTVFAEEVGAIDDVKQRVDAYMQQDSDASRLLTEDVRIIVATASDITGQIGEAFDQVTVFIAAIAGVSLLVGGIMIATILLISVAERTREIGVMKAIGGFDRDVLGLFLAEAALVGLAGSLLGILFGLGAGWLLVDGLFGGEDIAFAVPWDWVGIALLLGVGTGVVAGWLPARRATRIQPVEALGHE